MTWIKVKTEYIKILGMLQRSSLVRGKLTYSAEVCVKKKKGLNWVNSASSLKSLDPEEQVKPEVSRRNNKSQSENKWSTKQRKWEKSLKLKVSSLKRSTNWKACTHNDQGKAKTEIINIRMWKMKSLQISLVLSGQWDNTMKNCKSARIKWTVTWETEMRTLTKEINKHEYLYWFKKLNLYKPSHKEKSWPRRLQWWILPNISEGNNANYMQIFLENWTGVKTSPLILWGWVTLILKLEKDISGKNNMKIFLMM